MALWQFVFDLVPAFAVTNAEVYVVRTDRNQLNGVKFGFALQDTNLLYARLNQLLPEKQSWADGLRIWGDERAHDIQVHFDACWIELVQCRLDVRDPTPTLMNGVCALARDLSCVFVARDGGAVIQPCYEPLLRVMMQSRAIRFVNDPTTVLREAKPPLNGD
ncbi:hypothetical protein A9D14_12480 [Croceicoccus marinus]|uniref:Uncharacterized protein n=2 Tax=Croceicoccus marinus TaxID=450378 RepID=A0A1Z1FDS7_9SPHN|nr:hypothetical protein A9D14_12480 [Croceicoccus marinus]